MTIAYIGLGSNLGSASAMPMDTLTAAIAALKSVGDLVAQSSFYRTEPVGLAAQPAFVNAVVALESGLAAETLLQHLLEMERSFGRDRNSGLRNGPRTLDLDLLLLGQMVVATDMLVLPHPRLAERRFVLAPMAEIAPALLHPLLHKTMLELLECLPLHGENGPEAVQRIDPRES